MQQSGMGFRRAYGIGRKPIYQRDKAFLLAQGGFALDKTGLASNDILLGGTPLVFNEQTRVATVLRVAKLQANAASNAVNYRVEKGSPLNVGDNFAAVPGGAAYPITAIDTTNAAYDVVTVGTTLGVGLTAGQLLFNSSATGATAAAFPTGINGLLYEDLIVQEGIQSTVSAVIRATVYARRVPYSSQLAAVSGLGEIIYSQSF